MKFQIKHTQRFPVRLSFPQIWRAVKIRNKDGSEGDGKPSYAANVLIMPEDPQVAALNDLIDKIALEEWGEKRAKTVLAELRGKDKLFLHNGDFKSDYDGYAGMFYVTARSPTAPLIIGRNKEELREAGGRPYGGCYVNFSIDAYAQGDKSQWGRRINATLRGIQFVEDGEAFAGGPPATPEEFDDLDAGVEAQALA